MCDTMDNHMANDPSNNRQQNTTRDGGTLQQPKQKNWTNCYKTNQRRLQNLEEEKYDTNFTQE